MLRRIDFLEVGPKLSHVTAEDIAKRIDFLEVGPKLKQIDASEVASRIDFLEVGPKVQKYIDDHSAKFAVDQHTGGLTVKEVPDLQIADSATPQVPLDICSGSPYFVKNILQSQFSNTQR